MVSVIRSKSIASSLTTMRERKKGKERERGRERQEEAGREREKSKCEKEREKNLVPAVAQSKCTRTMQSPQVHLK